MMIIIDYGMGNLGSIQNMLKYLGIESKISDDKEDINTADKLILPGVGSFDTGMKNLEEKGFVDLLNKKVIKERTPILGVCLGMQLLTKSSEEGNKQGLGWLDANTIKFTFEEENNLKIPHMGWNTIRIEKENPLFKGLGSNDARFYFVHSYHVVCHKQDNIISTTKHGLRFVSSLNKENIYGTQFHPEKSHKYGMKVFKNFEEI